MKKSLAGAACGRKLFLQLGKSAQCQPALRVGRWAATYVAPFHVYEALLAVKQLLD